MATNARWDRRWHQRGCPAGTGMVFSGGKAAGSYVVRNVSAGGVLLSGGPLVPGGGRVRVLLRLAGHGEFRLTGTVLRQDTWWTGSSLAIAFHKVAAEVEDAIQDAVLGALARESEPCVLVVSSDIASLARLAGEVSALGRRPVLASTSVDTIRSLVDSESGIEAALVERFLCFGDGRDVLRIVGREHPSARRILVSPARGSVQPDLSVGTPRSYTTLYAPLDGAQLASALSRESSSAGRSTMTHEERSNANHLAVCSHAPTAG